MTNRMSIEHVKKGDTVCLVGTAWSSRRRGKFYEVGSDSERHDGGWRTWLTTGQYAASGLGSDRDWGAVLVRRGGKYVKHLAVRLNGSFVAEFEDGSRIHAYNASTVTTDLDPLSVGDEFPSQGWEILVRDYNVIEVGKSLHPEGESATIDRDKVNALADRLGLCDDFDAEMYERFGWGKRKQDTPTIGELRAVAHEKGYGCSFDEEFPKVEDEKPFTALPVPEVGDHVKVTWKDGATMTDVLASIDFVSGRFSDRGAFYALYGKSGRGLGHMHADRVCEHSDNFRSIVAIENSGKMWARGETVPAGKSMNVWWMYVSPGGIPSRVPPGTTLSQDREVAWVQE